MATPLAFDDSGGTGPLVVLLPGAGDVRSENRFLAPQLVAAGYRVVNADLPGHGESPLAPSYGVAECAASLLELLDCVEGGAACVVGASFAPAAAVWAAAEHPEVIGSVVAISPHLEAEENFKGRLLRGVISFLLSGPWSVPVWSRLYRSWYKGGRPEDLEQELAKMQAMLRDRRRRRAVRETLVAHRLGLETKIVEYACPTLVIFGTADDHFPDPSVEAAQVADRLHGETFLVDGAGHYPHVERPDLVGPAVLEFLQRVALPAHLRDAST